MPTGDIMRAEPHEHNRLMEAKRRGDILRTEPQSAPHNATSVIGDPAEHDRRGELCRGPRKHNREGGVECKGGGKQKSGSKPAFHVFGDKVSAKRLLAIR